ncbi:regulator of chromosome condensation 1/beta-lactamase-inhibitor protein II [Dissophora ornata]|nr:regulator of chromosome condensation 1/beta-lactamase-inhibitor protein II [Dissophora ornata]
MHDSILVAAMGEHHADTATALRTTTAKDLNLFQLLPFEILAGEIFATLPLTDLAQLARVCKGMHHICQSDYLWQRKFFRDFQYRPGKTVRHLGGWKRIYQAMDRVEVYTWGNNSDCRLGYGRTSKRLYESVPKRVRRLDGIGIVQLAPTGWGCHALDKHGNVWAWGRIMESNGIRSDAMPRMLKRPRNVIQLVAGRQVVLAKDANGQVWQWCRENKTVEVTFAAPNDHPIDQISAGWDICAALTRSGRLFAWRPPQSADGRYQHRIHVEHSVCLREQGYAGYEASVLDGDKFVQIAAGSDYVVAVTSLEKVYIFRREDSPHYFNPNALPHRQIPSPSQHPVLHSHFGSSEKFNDLLPSSSSRPTFVSASYERFALHHSSGKVILGKEDVQKETCPIVIERFHSNVSQVAFGDHHQGLLTEDGQLRTWGSFCDGALGQGDLRNGCAIPNVIEGPLKNKIVIAVEMAGWQSACLAIDMSDEKAAPYNNSHYGLSPYSVRAHPLGKDKEEMLVDDGYYSLENASSSSNGGSANGSGSSSEGFDSSDGEEWTTLDNEMRDAHHGSSSLYGHQTHTDRLTLSSGSKSMPAASLQSSPSTSSSSSLSATSPWVFPAEYYLPHSPSCAATCLLLVSPHNHRHGSGSSHSRSTPLRRRSSSMTEKHQDLGYRRLLEEKYGYCHRGYHYHGTNREEHMARMMALTRLSPKLTVYEPEASLDNVEGDGLAAF